MVSDFIPFLMSLGISDGKDLSDYTVFDEAILCT